MKLRFGMLILLSVMFGWVGNVASFDHVSWPDGRRVSVVQTNEQVDLASLRSGVTGRAVDRRFNTNEAMFLANEIYLSGTEFFLRASEQQLPIAHDLQFSYLTNVEAYWYSRYNLMSATARSRMGVGVIHGPYVDLRAQAATRLNVFGRNRGELAISNKDILLTDIVNSYLRRSGMPQKFENSVPLMLEFRGADPHLVKPVDIEPAVNGRPNYLLDFESLRWSHGRMDKTIDMGGVAQAMLKKVLWAKFFLRRNHMDVDFPGEIFLGNNAEDGLRGSILTLEAVSSMLLVKAALFNNPENNQLTGIDPTRYQPSEGLRYLPHEIKPSLIYMSDLPVRQYDFKIKDSTSYLWDQASWLWATTELFDFANPRKQDNWNQVFGYQTPYDGSVMEQKYALLAQGLANTILINIEVMHSVDGILVSQWTPKKGSGAMVSIADLSITMVALGSYINTMDLEQENLQRANRLLRRQADFLLQVAANDGSYTEQYSVPDAAGAGSRNMTSQAFAIRGLLMAYEITRDVRYLHAARRTSNTWNSEFWDSNAWLYRNQVADTHITYSPIDVAVALAALRELILVDRDVSLLDRFKKFFVQSIDVSGLMQAEDIYTGEDIEQIRAGNMDSDGDGIPFMSGGHGRHGIDTVFASRVEFDLGQATGRGGRTHAPTQLPTTGKQVYDANCAICHGSQGVGNEGPKLVNNPLVQLTGQQGVKHTIRKGRLAVGMPAWEGILNEQEINQVVNYIRSLE